MTSRDQLESLWDEYDQALIAYASDINIGSDPDGITSSREWSERARAALIAAKQTPTSDEDQAVVELGLKIWNQPGWMERLRPLRTTRNQA